MSDPISIAQLIIETAEAENGMKIVVYAKGEDGTMAILYEAPHVQPGDTLVVSFGDPRGRPVFSNKIKIQ